MRAAKRGAAIMFAVLAVAAAAACARPTIDGRSDETMTASIGKIRDDLSQERRAAFDEALATVMMSGAFANALDGGDVAADVRKSLDGKTADDVIREAAEMKAEEERRARENAVKEVTALEAERKRAETAAAELAKVEIVRARYALERSRFGMAEPRITLTVKNNTSHPISRAYFRGRLTSPGRPVPWLDEEFNYSIRGGLNPDEEATWNLAPNAFSAWGTVDAPADAGLQVTLLKVDGADGNELFSVERFTERDQARLEALKKQYGIQP